MSIPIKSPYVLSMFWMHELPIVTASYGSVRSARKHHMISVNHISNNNYDRITTKTAVADAAKTAMRLCDLFIFIFIYKTRAKTVKVNSEKHTKLTSKLTVAGLLCGDDVQAPCRLSARPSLTLQLFNTVSYLTLRWGDLLKIMFHVWCP